VKKWVIFCLTIHSFEKLHYEIMHTVRHDTEDGGYFFDLWVDAVPELLNKIYLVEYCFDHEFGGEYNGGILKKGPVHTVRNYSG
jgi:hypothetical protein